MTQISLRNQRTLGMSATRTLAHGLLYLILTAGAIVASIPMLWTLSSSLKDTAHIFTLQVQWLPNPVFWSNYPELFARLPFLQFISNTLLIVLSNVVSAILTGSLVAYAFARLRAPGKNFLFLLVISTMLLPGQVTLIPRYIIFSKLRMIDTYWPLIAPGWLGGGAFEIFLFRQFFLTLPVELDDAARIDGCSTLRIYWSIVMPLSKPVIATIAIFNFIWAWSDFFTPLIYLNSMEKFTLALGLATLQRSAEWSTRWELVMAGAVISVIPMLVVFFLGQKYFVQGISLTGVKA
ncbi:MAG: carbohydrate ABC transporter permease [Caldilineaceae bacterium]